MTPRDRKTLTIARRTRKNLEFMDKQKKAGADVEEFTQLLNSMFGMLICLRQEYFEGKIVEWAEVEKLGLTPVKIEGKDPDHANPDLEKATKFNQVISRMRHALAHNNFDFFGANHIEGIRVWNINKGKKVWEADVTENQLRDLAFLFIDYLERTRGNELGSSQEIPGTNF